MIRFRVDDYSLELTMYPSFTYTMYIVDHNRYVKVYGMFRGYTMRQYGKFLEYSNVPEDVMLLLSGLWYDPVDEMSKASKSIRSKLSKIADTYSCVRLAIDPYDTIHMFISVFLSRRTDFHTNVVKWCRSIFEHLEREGVRSVRFREISSSYQMIQLEEVVRRGYLDDPQRFSVGDDPWSTIRWILTIPYVGPKTTYAYVLFTSKYSMFAPTDVHMIRFNRRFNIVDANEAPVASYCLKYTCYNCPRVGTCITGSMFRTYGKLAGWIQTVAYVHDSLYCSRGRCDICPLRSECLGI